MDASETPRLKFLDRTQPRIPAPEAARAVEVLYGLQGDFSPLVSERDLNYRVCADDAREYVLKISNAAEESGVIDFQVQALQHLEAAAPELPLPRVVETLDRHPYARIRSAGGDTHLVHLLTYLPGETLGGKERPPVLWRELGRLLGQLDRALRPFFHPSARHELLWDIQRSPELLPLARHIPDRDAQRSVEEILAYTRDQVLPAMRTLRHQVIHADVHADNLLANRDAPGRIAGLLDFGDMVHAPLVAEIAIAADMDTLPPEAVLECLRALVSAYDRVLPLEAEELSFVYPLILARYAATAAITAWRREQTPDQPPYIPITEESLWTFLDRFQYIGERQVLQALQSACRFPVSGLSEEVTRDMLARRKAHLGEAAPIFYEQPVHLARGRGTWLYGADGHTYLDAYNNVPVAGHSHPHVVRAVARQMEVLNTNTRYLYRVILDYCERLAATFSGGLSMCLFANSGSEANDIAWQIAKFSTGRQGVLVMENAYHGITESIRELSPSGETRPLASHVRMLENPDPYRGRYRRGEAELAEKYAADADRAIASLEEAGLGVAGFMVDSAFVSSGIPDVPDGYLVRVAEKVRAAGGLVIADEVQAGFGRSGTHMWGHAAHGMTPDIVTLGKPVGNGFPLGVVVTTPAILEPFLRDTGLFSTFGGNPVACAAGMAVLDVIEEEDLIRNSFETGAYLRHEIRDLMDRHARIGDVRGRGLLVGVEIVKSRETRAPAGITAAHLVEEMRRNGVLIGREGLHGNVLKIRPPLVFRETHADLLIAALDQALRKG